MSDEIEPESLPGPTTTDTRDLRDSHARGVVEKGPRGWRTSGMFPDRVVHTGPKTRMYWSPTPSSDTYTLCTHKTQTCTRRYSNALSDSLAKTRQGQKDRTTRPRPSPSRLTPVDPSEPPSLGPTAPGRRVPTATPPVSTAPSLTEDVPRPFSSRRVTRSRAYRAVCHSH